MQVVLLLKALRYVLPLIIQSFLVKKQCFITLTNLHYIQAYTTFYKVGYLRNLI